MKNVLFAALFVSLFTPAFSVPAWADWPQFRGSHVANLAEGAKLPLTWDVKTKANVAWEASLPGRGVSGPIVVRDRVIVTSNDGARQQLLHVHCFDTARGEEIWKRTFWATGRTSTHPTSANAAPTPASDGQLVFAFYSSNDLVCLDLDGNLQWFRGLALDFPKAGNDVGMASSPLVAGDVVIVQIENQGDSFAAALDKRTGETRWKIPRVPQANWASPTLWPASDDRPAAVLLQCPTGLAAVEANTGRQLWKYDASCGTISSPLAVKDLVITVSNGLTALKTTGSAPEVAWTSPRLRPGSSSPIVQGDYVYTIADGVLKCGALKDGDLVWQTRVQGKQWATPFLAGEHLYVFNQDGSAKVVKLGEKPDVVGSSEFGEELFGSPAVSGNAIYVRSAKHLWKIAAP